MTESSPEVPSDISSPIQNLETSPENQSPLLTDNSPDKSEIVPVAFKNQAQDSPGFSDENDFMAAKDPSESS